MVGQRAVTPWLRQVGSIPTSSTIFGRVGKLVTPAGCKPAAFDRHYWFDSSRVHQLLEDESVFDLFESPIEFEFFWNRWVGFDELIYTRGRFSLVV